GGGEAAGERAARPFVGVAPGAPVADVNHRLDGDDHAGPEHWARVGCAVVGDLRVLVHVAADTVTDGLPDDGEVLPFDPRLNGRADLADPGTAVRGRDPPPDRFARHLDQLLGHWRKRPGPYCHRHVCGEALVGPADIDPHNVAVRYLAEAGYAVDDRVVHG